MATVILKRQFIMDATGHPIGVILPLEEFAAVQEILEQRFPSSGEDDRPEQMEKAAKDRLFMADLHETMSAFAELDAQ